MTNQNIKIEEWINDIFYKTCFFVSVIALTMALIEFFSRGHFPSSRIGFFYIGVLLLYSLHKEAMRWVGEKGTDVQQRKGEIFVALWIIITTLLYLINFLTKNYFVVGQNGLELPVLKEISFITLEVSAVFILTRIFKIGTIYFFRAKEEK